MKQSIQERLILLSMHIAERGGPVIGPLPADKAVALDNRILELMYEAYCMGKHDALKHINQIIRKTEDNTK